MTTFTWPPSYGAQLQVQPKILSAKYGDGYEQRIAYGINNRPQSWSLGFSSDSATIDAIEDFLNTAGGVSSFTWTTPDALTTQFVCRQWSRTFIDLGVHSLTATFEQVFGE